MVGSNNGASLIIFGYLTIRGTRMPPRETLFLSGEVAYDIIGLLIVVVAFTNYRCLM